MTAFPTFHFPEPWDVSRTIIAAEPRTSPRVCVPLAERALCRGVDRPLAARPTGRLPALPTAAVTDRHSECGPAASGPAGRLLTILLTDTATGQPTG